MKYCIFQIQIQMFAKKSEYQPIFASMHFYKIEFGKVVCDLTMCLAFCTVSKMIKNMHCGTSIKCENRSSELFVKINRVYVIISSAYKTYILLILTNKCFIIIANVHIPLFLVNWIPEIAALSFGGSERGETRMHCCCGYL